MPSMTKPWLKVVSTVPDTAVGVCEHSEGLLRQYDAEFERIKTGIRALCDNPYFAQVVVQDTTRTDPTPLVMVSDLLALLYEE